MFLIFTLIFVTLASNLLSTPCDTNIEMCQGKSCYNSELENVSFDEIMLEVDYIQVTYYSPQGIYSPYIAHMSYFLSVDRLDYVKWFHTHIVDEALKDDEYYLNILHYAAIYSSNFGLTCIFDILLDSRMNHISVIRDVLFKVCNQINLIRTSNMITMYNMFITHHNLTSTKAHRETVLKFLYFTIKIGNAELFRLTCDFVKLHQSTVKIAAIDIVRMHSAFTNHENQYLHYVLWKLSFIFPDVNIFIENYLDTISNIHRKIPAHDHAFFTNLLNVFEDEIHPDLRFVLKFHAILH